MPTINDLGRQVKAKYPGQYDDLADIEVGRRTKAKYPTDYADFADADSARITVRGHERKRPEIRRGKSGLEKAADWLPAAGGMVGGIAGGIGGTVAGVGVGGAPGAVGGAAVGGAGGEALRQLVYDLDPSQIPTDNLQAPLGIAKAAFEQAVAELLGLKVIGPVLKGAAHLGMGAALRFTPEVAQTAVREGIAATKGGLAKLGQKLGDYGQRTLAMVRQNTQRFAPMDVLQGGGQALADEVTKSQTGLGPEVYAQYRKEAQKFMARHTRTRAARGPNGTYLTSSTGDMSAAQLQAFKQEADDIAGPILRAVERGEKVDITDQARAKWYKAMGAWARQELERTTPDMIDPVTGRAMSLAESNAQTRGLIELKQVLVPDIRTERGIGARLAEKIASPAGRMVSGATLGAGAGAALPGGNNGRDALVGATLGAGFASPQIMSLLALALAHRGTAAVGGQVPRLGMQVMQAAHEQ